MDDSNRRYYLFTVRKVTIECLALDQPFRTTHLEDSTKRNFDVCHRLEFFYLLSHRVGVFCVHT